LTWSVVLTPTAQSMLAGISDRRIRRLISDRIDGLAEEPEKQGAPLVGELTGYRSIGAAGQRYHVIYRLEDEEVIVVIVAVGIRKEGSRTDIYELARRLFRLKLLDPQPEAPDDAP